MAVLPYCSMFSEGARLIACDARLWSIVENCVFGKIVEFVKKDCQDQTRLFVFLRKTISFVERSGYPIVSLYTKILRVLVLSAGTCCGPSVLKFILYILRSGRDRLNGTLLIRLNLFRRLVSFVKCDKSTCSRCGVGHCQGHRTALIYQVSSLLWTF